MKKVALLCAAAIGLLFIFACSFFINRTALVVWLQDHRLMLDYWVADHYVISVMMYIVTYIVLAALSLPVSLVATTLAGFLFGTYWGTLYAIIATTGGAVAAFIIIRYLFSHARKMQATHLYKRYVYHMNMHSVLILLGLRLMLCTPFFAINIMAAISKVPLSTFAWTTFVGLIPEIFLHASAGHQLAVTHQLHDLFSWPIILMLMGLSLLLLMPVIVRFIQDKKKSSV